MLISVRSLVCLCDCSTVALARRCGVFGAHVGGAGRRLLIDWPSRSVHPSARSLDRLAAALSMPATLRVFTLLSLVTLASSHSMLLCITAEECVVARSRQTDARSIAAGCPAGGAPSFVRTTGGVDPIQPVAGKLTDEASIMNTLFPASDGGVCNVRVQAWVRADATADERVRPDWHRRAAQLGLGQSDADQGRARPAAHYGLARGQPQSADQPGTSAMREMS